MTYILPLDSVLRRYRYQSLQDNMPRGFTAEALVESGLLVRSIHTGSLAVWTGRTLRSIDQFAVQRELDALAADDETPPQ